MSSSNRTSPSRWFQIAVSGVLVLWAAPALADLVPGMLSDFESGTVEGWDGSGNTLNVATGGPLGAGDNYLQISPGNESKIASYNASVFGIIDATATDVDVDMMRPTTQGDIEVRLVLFGPDLTNQWTSTVAEVVPDDGIWRTYSYSLFEADLTQTFGSSTYAQLEASLSRIMIRNNSGAPSSTGQAGTGVLNIDNVFVVPEPSASAAGLSSLFALYTLTRWRSRDRAASSPPTLASSPSARSASARAGRATAGSRVPTGRARWMRCPHASRLSITTVA